MTTSKVREREYELAWSPHAANDFVVGGDDLRFYSLTFKNEATLLRRRADDAIDSEVSTKQTDVNDAATTSSLAGDHKWLTLRLINSELPNFRCLTWSPPNYTEQCLAIGQTTGRVALTSLAGVHSVSKQFLPRHSRACNALAWNASHTGYLAAGLDKVRGDYSTLIWDVSQDVDGSNSNAPPTNDISRPASDADDVDYLDDPSAAERHRQRRWTTQRAAARKSTTEGPASGGVVGSNVRATMSATDNVFDVKPHVADQTVTKPLYELCNSEGTVSLAWLPDVPTALTVGTGVKWLRIIDLRAGAQAARSVVAHARAVMGVAFDPFHDRRLLTFSEDGVVKLWDTRRLVEPTYTLTVGNRNLHRVVWCPTRSGILATHAGDDLVIKLWDLKQRVDLPRAALIEDANVGHFASASETTRLAPRHVHVKRGVSSLAWHPTNEDLILTVSQDAMLELVTLSKPVSMAFSPLGQLAFVHERRVVIAPTTAASVALYGTANDTQSPFEIDDDVVRRTGGAVETDVALLIRARARVGYSMDVTTNYELVRNWSEHPKLAALWTWLHDCIERDERAELARIEAARAESTDDEDDAGDGQKPLSSTVEQRRATLTPLSPELRAKRRHMGVLSLLYDSDAGDNDVAVPQEDFATAPLFTVRVSPQRQRCLDHIGWRSTAHLDETLRHAEDAGEYERAAALAVFFMDLKKAIQILYRAQTTRARAGDVPDDAVRAAATASAAAAGRVEPDESGSESNSRASTPLPSNASAHAAEANVNLKLVAMALAGYEGGSLWRQTCRSLMNQIKHPYLQACFAFLCSERRDKHFKSVLACNMSLRDKIGFAMRFLDDGELYRFIERRTAAVVRQGDLEGVVLTGLANNRAVDLFQSYANRTGDVQTACLAMSHVVPVVFEDSRVRQWVESYRDLLDQWRMWRERALFDTQRVPFGDHRLPPQIFARCSSCGQSLTVGVTANKGVHLRGAGYHGGRDARQRGRNDQKKLRCCAGCAKPLPRCAVCLLALAAAMPGSQRRVDGSRRWHTAEMPFEDWFTWCQSCKHGGHAQHILHWFEEHQTCPVSSCECRCADI